MVLTMWTEDVPVDIKGGLVTLKPLTKMHVQAVKR